jgi:glycosyltransferase involved in cell wall biosynthesis
LHQNNKKTAKTWSIIIPTLNEQRCIGQCLDSLCASGYNLSDLEVIIADNGSSDRTVSIALSYAARIDISALALPGIRLGALRNAAVSNARGLFLVFLDADCTIHPGWLASAMVVVREHPSAIVGSYYALPVDAGWPARLWHQRFHAGRTGDVAYLPGGNLIMESAVFRKVGGFNTHLRSNEDGEFCARARAIGIRVLAFPHLAAVHLGAEKTLLQFAKRQLWHGSNVLSRYALRANARAIALAAYTLMCVVGVIATRLTGSSVLVIVLLAAALLPPTIMAVLGARKISPANVPQLLLLLLTYALARALVLPRALVRAAKQEVLNSQEAALQRGL